MNAKLPKRGAGGGLKRAARGVPKRGGAEASMDFFPDEESGAGMPKGLIDPYVSSMSIWSVWGVHKSGKTHWGLHFPAPVAILSVGESNTRLAKRMTKTIGSMIRYYPRPSANGKAEDRYSYKIQGRDFSRKRSDAVKLHAEKGYANFLADLREAIDWASEREGTVVVDTITKVWEMVRMSLWGALTQDRQHYTEANHRFASLFGWITDPRTCHVVLSSYADDVWKNKEKTDKKKRKGFGDLDFIYDENIQVTKARGNSSVQLLDSRFNRPLEGSKWGEDDVLNADELTEEDVEYLESGEARWRGEEVYLDDDGDVCGLAGNSPAALIKRVHPAAPLERLIRVVPR